jgi:hypothetical protein
VSCIFFIHQEAHFNLGFGNFCVVGLIPSPGSRGRVDSLFFAEPVEGLMKGGQG